MRLQVGDVLAPHSRGQAGALENSSPVQLPSTGALQACSPVQNRTPAPQTLLPCRFCLTLATLQAKAASYACPKPRGLLRLCRANLRWLRLWG